MSVTRVSLLGLLACVVLAAAAGRMPARAEEPPSDIAEIISETAQLCRTAGGKPDTAAVLSGEDLNGDGANDWIADFAKVKCDGADNPACNPDGCLLRLYFLIDGALELVFEDFVRNYKFSTSGDTRLMHVTTSGIPCNKPAEETCSYNYQLGKDAISPVQ